MGPHKQGKIPRLQTSCDRLICETVNRVTRQDALAFLNEPVFISDVPDVEKGEVLVDSRVLGSFQL